MTRRSSAPAPFYYNGTIYDRMVPEDAGDLKFWRWLAAKCGGPVLELCCGTGRIACDLARRGHEVTGVDLSASMIRTARARGRGLRNLTWLRRDVAGLEAGRNRFALVAVPFGSLGHFHTLEQIREVFDTARRHLRPGGLFAFDINNPHPQLVARDPDIRLCLASYHDPDLGLDVLVEEAGEYDRATQVMHLTWYRSLSDGRLADVDSIRLRVFYPQEILALVEAAGFRVVHRYGNYSRRRFGSDSPRQILVCKPVED